MADSKPQPVEIVCTLDYPLTHKQCQIFERAIRAAFAEACPDAAIRGLWVHERIQGVGEHPPDER